MSDADTEGWVPASSLASHYRWEAETCWEAGAYVATILMSQLAFEELLRAHYRAAIGYGGQLSDGTRVSASGFSDLIRAAEQRGVVSASEAGELHELRSVLRNPYVHTRDKPSNPDDWSNQMFKVAAPELLGIGVDDEARQAIQLLASFWPTLARRLWGLE